jgi:ABC-2 type transport system permease protein
MMRLDRRVICAIAGRTLRNAVESPIAYVAGLFFYSLVGALFAVGYFVQNQAGIESVNAIAPWGLWFVIPVLTMGLFSDEMRSGTYESLATLPVSDTEIVLGKFFGFAALALLLIGGLFFFVIVAAVTAQPGIGIDWGSAIGTLAGLYFVSLTFGAMGLFASSLVKSQVVAVIIALIFCTALFLVGQFYAFFSGGLARLADFLGVMSHLNALSRGVWDLRDLFYFASVVGFFLFLTVQRLSTRRF